MVKPPAFAKSVFSKEPLDKLENAFPHRIQLQVFMVQNCVVNLLTITIIITLVTKQKKQQL